MLKNRINIITKISVVIMLCYASLLHADDKSVLQQRLDKVEGFYAQFHQTVNTTEGQLIQEGNGELWVRRPAYFNWFISQPDEMRIVADGKNLWIYSPILEQVTVMSLQHAVDNRLLQLITNSQHEVWSIYDVTRQQNTFTLTPKDNSAQRFIITVLPTGMIADFSILEEDDMRSDYELSHQRLEKNLPLSIFEFVVPENVILDDQR